MTRRLDLHGSVAASPAPPLFTRSPSGEGARDREANRLGDLRPGSAPARESAVHQADDRTIANRRIATSRDRFTSVFGARPPACILFDASTEGEWMARHLESLGHEVIVADPNDAPMYANRSRRTKTDKRDARTLMDACATSAWQHSLRDVPGCVAAGASQAETEQSMRDATAFHVDGLRANGQPIPAGGTAATYIEIAALSVVAPPRDSRRARVALIAGTWAGRCCVQRRTPCSGREAKGHHSH